MKPLVYLDIDDTLIRHMTRRSMPAPGAGQFLAWLHDQTEVHWLTMWFPYGTKSAARSVQLAEMLEVPVELIDAIPAAGFALPEAPGWSMSDGEYQPYRNYVNKARGLDEAALAAGRPWAWVEDGLEYREREWLRERRWGLCHVPCNVTTNQHRLVDVAEILVGRFGLAPWQPSIVSPTGSVPGK